MSNFDIDYLREWIGRSEVKTEMATTSLVARFNATFELNKNVADGDPAPALIHFCLAQPAAPTSELGEDGHPARGGFLPPVPLPRRMWASGSLAFHGDVRIGDMVSRHSKIRDVVIKEGRSGTLCFVTIDHRIESEGRHVIDERQDIVYRGADIPDSLQKTPDFAPKGTNLVTIVPSPILLFRYSALTFNGHRIHYDLTYARDVEFYPGLIVHGPMQATMLIQFAETLGGRLPAKFEFRSLSPLFDDKNFTLNAIEVVGGLKLWTSAVDGPIAMEALATW